MGRSGSEGQLGDLSGFSLAIFADKWFLGWEFRSRIAVRPMWLEGL